MGITYNDDISKEPLLKEDSYTIEVAKFSPKGDKFQKSKRFYVSMASLTKIFGDVNFGWQVYVKQDGSWNKTDGPL